MEIKDIEKVKSRIDKVLKNNEEYKGYSIDFLLIDRDDTKNAVAVAIEDGELILVDMPTREINEIDDRYYNYDDICLTIYKIEKKYVL